MDVRFLHNKNDSGNGGRNMSVSGKDSGIRLLVVIDMQNIVKTCWRFARVSSLSGAHYVSKKKFEWHEGLLEKVNCLSYHFSFFLRFNIHDWNYKFWFDYPSFVKLRYFYSSIPFHHVINVFERVHLTCANVYFNRDHLTLSQRFILWSEYLREHI
jgi:hypothetical protein